MTEERLKEIKDSIEIQKQVLEQEKELYSYKVDEELELYNEVIRLREENKRLNNIINEIEAIVYADISNIDCRISIQERLDKLKELERKNEK